MGWRSLRGGIFALLAVGVAIVAHTAGGAPLPAAPTLVALGAGLAVLATAAGGREWRLPGLAAAAAAVQVGLHVALIGSAGSGAAGGSLVERLLCHSAAGPVPAGVVIPPYLHVAAPRPAMLPAVLMLLGHALATVTTTWWLRRGERAVWAARRLLGAWIRTYPWVPAVAGPPAPVRPPAAPALRPYLLLYAVAGRAPPAGCA